MLSRDRIYNVTELLKRLCRLEALTAPKTNDVASWPARAAAVKQCAIGKMSVLDRALLEQMESNSLSRQELIDRNPAVWARWNEAFEWAVREVPAPYVMSISDLFGQW